MKADLRRFAPIGLVVAALGLIVSLGVLLLKGFIYYGLYTPKNPQLISAVGIAAAGFAVLGLSSFAILDPERTRVLLTGRQARQGSNAVILLLAFTGILVFINGFVYRYPKSWDVTSTKQNTLAPETLKTLAALPEPVKAVAFFRAQTSTTQAKALLEKYKTAGQGHFDYSFVDPDANPALAQEAQISSDGTIALYMGSQKELVTAASEQEITGGLVRLLNPEVRAVYFLTGHGELQTDTPGNTAYTTARKVLESKNYAVRALNLVELKTIPDDAKTVVIAGPQTSLSADEIAKLREYLGRGGGLIVMEEPPLLTKMGDKPDLLAGMLESDWGIVPAKDMVVDPNVNPPLGAATLPTAVHPITQGIQNTDVLFPTARSLSLDPKPGGPTLTDLGSTGSSAWGDMNYSTTNPQLVYDEGVDTPGPLEIAVAAEDPDSGARLVAFGDAEFASDSTFSSYANGAMFINAVDWAAGQDKLISLTPYSAAQPTFVPPSPLVSVALMTLALCILPLLIVSAGVWVWIAHRRRG